MKPQDEYDGPFPKSVFPPSAFPRRIFPWMGGNDDEDESKPAKPDWERNNSDDNEKRG